MERSRNDLESIVNSQKEQLSRYEKRLKDIIAAYKSLLKEKEALETSLSTFLSNKNEKNDEPSSSKNIINVNEETESKDDVAKSNEAFCLQGQISTLMNSLATLSAEKSRMEASFQSDKKAMRTKLQQKEQIIIELENKVKRKEDQVKIEIDEYKAKLIIERQEREKETNNQILMIRELQKLYADERHLKESIEMQLNNLKMQFANNEAENTRMAELQIQLKDAKTQILQLTDQKTNLNYSSSAGQSSSTVLLTQLQQEMKQLKEQHAIAIKSEQQRAQLAEEQSRKLAVLHENRVANLESRLSELSTSVGTYDRLRQQDQESIQLLKMQIHELEKMAKPLNETQIEGLSIDLFKDKRTKIATLDNNDMSNIVENMMHLKKIILQANKNSINPIDLSNIFSVVADHSHCEEELARTTHQLETLRLEKDELKKNIKQRQDHIITLQEKVKDLNRNIDEQDLELKNFNEKLRLTVKEERAQLQTLHADIENEYRCKLNDLEQQLQKQRQRSLQLLDEKEQEIRALQTSFEIFHSSNQVSSSNKTDINNAILPDENERYEMEQDDITYKKSNIKGKKISIGDNCHMLHYANEIARKDIEIANLRKAKYQAETAMRKAIHDKVTTQEELNNKIGLLEEQKDRLERCMSREGANLEYLKNVIISYIISKDADGKRHMMNAISAVLQFAPQETKIINESFNKK